MTAPRRRPLTGLPLGATELLHWLGDGMGVRANMVTSPDGHATIRGRVGELTGEADQGLLLGLRGWCDVLLVGAGTIRAEGYGLVDVPEEARTVRETRGQSARPVLAILSGTLDLNPALPAFAEAGPDERPWVLTTPAAGAERWAALEPYAHLVDVGTGPDGRPSLPAAVAALRAAGLPRVLSEGGPTVLGELVGHGVVDELFVTISPTLVGGEGLRILHAPAYEQPVDLHLLDVLGAADEVFLRYRVGDAAGFTDSSGGAERA